MSVLLDTCGLLWLAFDQGQLSPAAVQAIEDAGGEVWVSAISAFEIALKYRLGKLSLPLAPELWYPEALVSHGLQEVSLTGELAMRAAGLPLIHRDPADRFLIATAMERGMELATPDPLIKKYPGVRVVW